MDKLITDIKMMITDNTSFPQIFLNHGKRLCLSAIAQIPTELPVLCGWKDAHSRYMGISQSMLSFSGLGARENVLGKLDRDIEQFSLFAESYVEWDQVAMKYRPVQMFEKCAAANNEFIDVIVTKFPIYHEKRDDVIGVFYTVIPAHHYNHHTAAVNFFMSNESSVALSGTHYRLMCDGQIINLTEQESMLMYYYLRGRTSSEIAASLGLSKRTIETYLDSIKQKSNCRARSQLVDLVMENKLFDFIPKKMLVKRGF